MCGLSIRKHVRLFSALTRVFVQTVLAFYAERMKKAGVSGGHSGAVVALQRTSSDLRLNPHLHVLFLDGVYQEAGENVVFHALPHLGAREVGSVLDRAVRRIERFLKKRGLLRDGDSDSAAHDDADPDAEPTVAQGHAALCTSAASGTSPPAGPEFRRKAAPLGPLAGKALSFDKPLCASLDHFTLHAATRAGGLDTRAREALVKYVLRPPVAQERVTAGPDGLVRIALKRPFADGTVAIDLDPGGRQAAGHLSSRAPDGQLFGAKSNASLSRAGHRERQALRQAPTRMRLVICRTRSFITPKALRAIVRRTSFLGDSQKV